MLLTSQWPQKWMRVLLVQQAGWAGKRPVFGTSSKVGELRETP